MHGEGIIDDRPYAIGTKGDYASVCSESYCNFKQLDCYLLETCAKADTTSTITSTTKIAEIQTVTGDFKRAEEIPATTTEMTTNTASKLVSISVLNFGLLLCFM